MLVGDRSLRAVSELLGTLQAQRGVQSAARLRERLRLELTGSCAELS